jgi:hypothetical protein
VTGDYRPILPLLRDAKVDRVNLEFAYPGTGDVSDLHLLPNHLGLGMGVVDVRSERGGNRRARRGRGQDRRPGTNGIEPGLRLCAGRWGATDDR